MPTNDRERMSDVSEFFLLIGEKVAEVAHRLRVEAIKATRIGRIRMEMVLLRRDRRAAIFRLGEAAHAAIREGRVADPALATLAREVDDVNAALEAKQDEIARIADLPDEAVIGRKTAGGPDGEAGRGEPPGSVPVGRRGPDEPAGWDGGEAGQGRAGGPLHVTSPPDL